jgi:hypothetical protein
LSASITPIRANIVGPPKFRDQQQRLHRSLPWFSIMLGLGQLGDELCRVPERDELATARQGYRIIESPLAVHSPKGVLNYAEYFPFKSIRPRGGTPL